jgi:hypothetical protein
MNDTLTKKILKVLFALVILLLISELVIEKLYSTDSDHTTVINKEEADSVFLKILDNFGIEQQWITKKGNNYIIKIPADVPSEIIMLDLSEYFRGRDLSLQAQEIVRNTKSFMTLVSDETVVLSAEFIYDKKISRNLSTLSFVILNAENLSETDINELTNLTDNFTIALVPSKKNRALAELLFKKGKDYSVLINSSINELEYKIDDKFSDKKIKITFQTITSHFPKAGYFILDDLPTVYSGRVATLLDQELTKRKIRYRFLNNYKKIEEITSASRFLSLIDHPGDKVFVMEASDFLKYKQGLSSLRKKGIRITAAL